MGRFLDQTAFEANLASVPNPLRPVLAVGRALARTAPRPDDQPAMQYGNFLGLAR